MTESSQHGWADDARRYRLDSRIATGGMGEVWRATDTTLERTVAVKLLKAEYADDATFRSRFETEARHAAALHHPGVAGVFDFGEATATDGSSGGKPYLVMELVEGQPLSALLAEAKRAGRDLDPAVVSDLVAQAGDALGAAHAAGIVHRDVKPANLMVTPDGTVKITDFGIARAADGVQMTQTGAVMGTPQYLAPEQARGERATAASDVYALGVVAFECLAGRRPFEADSPVATALAHLRDPVPDLPSRVPADLAAVVRRSMSKDAADRYPDGRAFAAAVRRPDGAAAASSAAAGFAVVDDASDGTRVMRPTSSTPADPGPPVPPVALAPEPGDDGGSRKKKKGTPTWLLVLLALIALALVIGLFFLLTAGGDDETGTTDRPRRDRSSSTEASSSPPTSAPTSEPTSSDTAPETVTIDEDDYLGQPIDVVQQNLESKGLNVTPKEVANDGTHDQGDVSDVSPSGEVEVGSNITVSYYGEPEATTPEPPGQGGTPPGQGGETPGQDGDEEPGRDTTLPGEGPAGPGGGAVGGVGP